MKGFPVPRTNTANFFSKFKLILVIIITGLFLSATVQAVGPALHRLYDVSSDGTYYAKKIPDGTWLRDPDQPRLGYTPQSDGVEKILVVRVDFPDQPGQKDMAVFEEAFFGSEVSLKRYYADLTRAYETPLTIIPGDNAMIYPTDGSWIRLPNNESYYGQPDPSGNYPDHLAHLIQMVQSAMLEVIGMVDLTEYDRDGDGELDHLFIVHAGNDEAETGFPNDLWSLRFSAAIGTYDNVAVKSAIVVPENPNSSRLPIGTFCHEFFHGFGAPDLYDYELDGIGGVEPIGIWGLMSPGSFLGDGQYPAAISSYLQMDFDGNPNNGLIGWLTPTHLAASGENIPILALGESARESVYRIYIPGTNNKEYFLIENRYRTDNLMYDRALPNDGMLIWHIDEDMRATGYPYPVGFNDGPGLMEYFRVWLEDAADPDHTQSYILADAVFCLEENRTIFAANSWPGTAANGASEGEFSLYNISRSGPAMSFTLTLGPMDIPDEVFVSRNYPNPFYTFTQIDYGVVMPANCEFGVYNVVGQRVFHEKLGIKPSGYHQVTWDGQNNDGDAVVRGQYFYEIKIGSKSKYGQMLWFPRD